VARLRRFGEQIGWAFQVVDDILDVSESSVSLGKTAARIKRSRRPPIRRCTAWKKSRAIATELETKALRELDFYGERGTRLRQVAQFLVARRN